MDTALGSTAAEKSESADADLFFYSTRNEGRIGETTTPALIPPPFSSTLVSEVSTEQTYGTQANVDENKAQLAYPPSDATDASQLPPLAPVRPPSQPQFNDRAQSATISPTSSPPVAQNTSIQVSHVPTPASSAAPQGHQLPSQHSQESYHIPTAQSPRSFGNIPVLSPGMSGESYSDDSSSVLTHRQDTTALQPSPPTTPSMYPAMPSQPYGRQSVVTPQPHSLGSTYPFIPPPSQPYNIPDLTPQASWSTHEGTHQNFNPQSAPTQSYRLPSASMPWGQSTYAGVSQPFISRKTSESSFIPPDKPFSAAYNSIGETTAPRNANVFVASDPFRVSHRKEKKVDAPSDGLTFDDIPTAGSPPAPVPSRPYRSYSPPTMPAQSRYARMAQQTTPQSYSLPNRPTPQAQSTSQFYDTSNAPKPQPSQPIYAGTSQHFPQPNSSQFYSIPNAPTPQIHTGAPQPSQMSGSFPGPPFFRPAPSYPTGYDPTSQAIRSSSFVANDPFQVSYGGAAVDAPSNFDDISTARSSPDNPYGAPRQPTFGGGSGYYYPDTTPRPRPVESYGWGQIPTQPESYGWGHIPTQPKSYGWGHIPTQPESYGWGHIPTQPESYGWGHISTQPEAYSTFNDSRPWYQPEIHNHNPSNAYTNLPLPDRPPTQIPITQSSHRHHRRQKEEEEAVERTEVEDVSSTVPSIRHRRHSQQTPPTPLTPQDDASSKQENTGLAQPQLPSTTRIHPKPPVSVSRREDEEEERTEKEDVPSTVPLIHHFPIIPPNADDTVIPPAVPVNGPPSSPSRSQDLPFTQNKPQIGAGQNPFGPYNFDPLYLPYSPYVPYGPYLQHPQYQHANLPKKSIFSRLNGFFRSSQPANPQPFTAIYPQPFTAIYPQPFTAIYPQPFTQPFTAIYPPMDSDIDWHVAVADFFLVAFPKQMYLLLLLRLPSLYFSRVARIFEEADMSLPEIKKMALETASQGLTHEFEMEMAFESPTVPPAYKRLTSTWESFIDSVMREWKTFNIISVLLLTAILTILQIESAADDPLTRYTALFSLMCSLISLLFGCMYIIRFGSMRKSYKAAEWALEAKKTKMLIWWNVWILLAMPAIWLTWSIILYIVCIMSFIWRTGVTSTTPPGLSDTGLLVIRIVMTAVLGIGGLYGILIMTTFQRYGTVMDKAWKQRIDNWIDEKATGKIDSYAQLPLDDQPYYHPRSARYPRSRHNPSRYYRSSFDGRYPENTYTRAYGPPSPPACDPPPPRSSTPSKSYYAGAYGPPVIIPPLPGSPHSTRSSKYNDGPSINRFGPNQPDPQLDPKKPVATAEEFLPKTIPERPLYPILESSINEDEDNALGFSSGLENRSGGGGDDAPDDGNRVRFRLPSGSSDGQEIPWPRKIHPRKPPQKLKVEEI